MTLRSLSVYSLPVAGFFDSSTCASSLYVIAAAASMRWLRKSVIVNGWLKIVTSDLLFGLMPFFVSAAYNSNWLPQHQTPTFLPFIALTVVTPLFLKLTSVIPDRENICAMLTRLVPVSRVARRLGTQSTPTCAPPLATTCSGVMLGPPTFNDTSRPKSL